MARGAAKQRPTQRPRPAPQQGRKRGPAKPRNEYEAQMFFPRLRRQARWVFVFLALVFALGFVFFGVGSGSSLGDLLNPGSIFGTSASSGASLGSLKKKAEQHPRNARAQLDYVQGLDAKGRTDESLRVLERYAKLNPKDADVLNDLASRYDTKATDQLQVAQTAALSAQSVSGADLFPSLKLGSKGATIGTDPIVSAVTTKAQNASNTAQTIAQTNWNKEEAVLKKLVAISPDDTTAVYRLAQASASAGDTATAIKSLKNFLKLAPDAPEAAIAKAQLKQLQQPPALPSTGG
jgi:tetratricopeptide (TPR) repeat protein